MNPDLIEDITEDEIRKRNDFDHTVPIVHKDYYAGSKYLDVCTYYKPFAIASHDPYVRVYKDGKEKRTVYIYMRGSKLIMRNHRGAAYEYPLEIINRIIEFIAKRVNNDNYIIPFKCKLMKDYISIVPLWMLLLEIISEKEGLHNNSIRAIEKDFYALRMRVKKNKETIDVLNLPYEYEKLTLREVKWREFIIDVGLADVLYLNHQLYFLAGMNKQQINVLQSMVIQVEKYDSLLGEIKRYKNADVCVKRQLRFKHMRYKKFEEYWKDS